LLTFVTWQMSAHEWYERRGYREIATRKGIYVEPDRHGKVWDLTTVYLLRDLV
jgi:L-amino acid N-acyltransferase YncA